MLSVVVIFVLLVSASDWLGRSVFCTSPVICWVIVSKMTYNVLSGMLNRAIPYHTIPSTSVICSDVLLLLDYILLPWYKTC